MRIHAVTWTGPGGAAPPLVLLHGIWDTWAIFARAAGRLAAGRTVHALDLRGHGESDKPAEGYRYEDYAGDVAGVLRGLGIERPVLLGFSLGALVAARLAARGDARLAGLILEDPPYAPGADGRGRDLWLRALLDLKRLPFAEAVEGLSDLYPTRDRATNEAGARALLATADGPFRALLDPRAAPIDLPALLAGLPAPLLILRADPAAGGALGDAGRDALRAALPAAQIVEFPGSGHPIHGEREEAFVAAVEAFCGGLAGER